MKPVTAYCAGLVCLTLTLTLTNTAEARLLRRRSLDRAIPSGTCPLGSFLGGDLRFTADGPSATLKFAASGDPLQQIDDVFVVDEALYTVTPEGSCNGFDPFDVTSGTAVFLERFDSEANGWSLAGARLVGGSLAVDPGGSASITVSGLQPGRTYVVGASWFTDPDESNNLITLSVDTRDPKALYLSGGRFRIDATWRTAKGATGTGQAVPLTDDTGYFWFFDPANVEVTVKVIDACSLNHRYWIFAGGLTNVRVDLRIADTATGVTKTYSNPLGTSFKPILDTGALATCP